MAIIDGKSMAREIKESLAKRIKNEGIKASLAVVLVGDDPGSKIYVNSKEKDANEIGIGSVIRRLPGGISQDELEREIRSLNSDANITGILVQLPLPKHLDEARILELISPKKDVDGLHEVNMGRLLLGKEPYHYPCTPSGIMEMLFSTKTELKGKNAVVIGRSNIVGKPIAQLLLRQHLTVTMCHSRTKDLAYFCEKADILVVAIGKPKFLRSNLVKDGAVVIDVGMNRTPEGLFGDVDFEDVKNKASFITPVPGGVGPMTRAMLMKNCVHAAEL